MIEIANQGLGKLDIKLEDNHPLILLALEHAAKRALETVGEVAEGYAKEELSKKQKHASGPDRPYVDTGRLRNDISFQVRGDGVYIGTNVEYALWVEVGTGIYASDGQGRKDVPWAYQDDEGNWHMTSGVMPVHFLKKAATEHTEEYKRIIKEAMENA